MKFMANLHIFYICLYKTMYASIIVRLWSAISGGGGEHFILQTNLSRVYFFQISYKYIEIYMVSMITTLIYRTFVYLCSLLISGCSSFPSDNFRHGLNGSHVNLNNILNIFQSFVNIQCFRQEFTITCRYICTGQRKRPHRYTCSHTHRPMSAPVDGSDPCKCKLRLKKVKMLFRQTDKQ